MLYTKMCLKIYKLYTGATYTFSFRGEGRCYECRADLQITSVLDGLKHDYNRCCFISVIGEMFCICLTSTCVIIKVNKEKTLFEQEIYHGSTVDLILPLYGGKSNYDSGLFRLAQQIRPNFHTTLEHFRVEA